MAYIIKIDVNIFSLKSFVAQLELYWNLVIAIKKTWVNIEPAMITATMIIASEIMVDDMFLRRRIYFKSLFEYFGVKKIP